MLRREAKRQDEIRLEPTQRSLDRTQLEMAEENGGKKEKDGQTEMKTARKLKRKEMETGGAGLMGKSNPKKKAIAFFG